MVPRNVIISLFFVLACLMLAACSATDSRGERPGAEQTATKVIVETVEFASDLDKFETVGTARAIASADIFPEVSGEVTAVLFKPGQRVTKGQTLLRFEERTEKLDVRRAEVAVRDAEQLLDRYDRIDVPGAISDSQVDVAKTALEAARIDLELAQDRQMQRKVVAPFSGYVGLSDIDAGARIGPQTQITRLDDRSSLLVDFSVPEQVFGALNPGDEISIRPFALAGEAVTANIGFIDSGVDPVTRSFIVRAVVDNTEDRMRPGMSFRIEFSQDGERLPKVPEAAISYGGDGPYIWAVEEGKAVRKSIDVVSRKQGSVLIRGDFSETTLIVVEGVQKVREGSALDIINAPLNAIGATQIDSLITSGG